MDSCLLCLENNRNILGCIKAHSKRWLELEVTKAIEKHFWQLNTIQLDSWLCLSCWQELNSFHKFYLRIEEAHLNFGQIKLEDLETILEFKEEIPQNSRFESFETESDKYEVIVKQPVTAVLSQPEISFDEPPLCELVSDKEAAFTKLLYESDIDSISGTKISQRSRLYSTAEVKDPLKKSTQKRKRNCKTRIDAEGKAIDWKIKDEPIECNIDHDPIDVSNRADVNALKTSEIKKFRAYSKNRTNPKENDKFIAEHMREMLCDLCQAPFENFPAMQKHFLEAHKQSAYIVCCKKKFSDRARLVDHLHCHLNPDHFKCKECGKTMSNRIKFDNHMLRTHNTDGVVKRHSCEVCGKSFREACVLRTHKLTHLSDEEKKFPCSDCGKKYGSPYVLNQHRQSVHLKRFAKICYICGKSINSSAEFKVHMNRHEGIPLPAVNCDECGLRLTSERGLKRHKESQHPVGGKQDHHCPICPKVSPTLKALRKHISNMHEKGYDYKCSICEKAFKRSEALREHMATHTGTTLYTCPWCPKTFNSNGNMHAHRKKIHPKEWEESKLQKYSSDIRPES